MQMEMEKKKMRKLLIATGLAAMIASPAMAQSYSAGYGTGNIISVPAPEHGGFAASTGAEAFAAAPGRGAVDQSRGLRAQALTPDESDTVYESGQYVGRDPDPNVRLELRRDWTHD